MAPLSHDEAMASARRRLAEKTILIPFSDCHYFTGCADGHGYGHISVNRRRHLAHRVAFELAFGPIPKMPGYHGAVIRHLCDTPSCVNPRHLALGSQDDNMKDKVAKGRQARGSEHAAASLRGRRH
jgi:hypothetical protein